MQETYGQARRWIQAVDRKTVVLLDLELAYQFGRNCNIYYVLGLDFTANASGSNTRSGCNGLNLFSVVGDVAFLVQ